MTRRRLLWAVMTLSLLAVVVAMFLTRSDADCSPAARMRIEGDSRLPSGGNAALESGAEGVSVLVTSEDGFTVGALFWILRIGETEFSLSRYPDFVDTTILFPLPDEALPGLRDGDPISIRYGNPTARSGANGWGPAPIDTEPATRVAVLRITDRCPS